jgi:hypothetical protein
MSLFYKLEKKKNGTLIQFNKNFIVFNCSIYISFILFLITSLLRIKLLSLFFGFIAISFAILRTLTLLRLKYVNKPYLKEGSMFSLTKPISITILNNGKNKKTI